jgi:cholesterol transport system auxiliary component
MLEGNLLEFGVDAAKRSAVVTYDASLMSPDGLRLTRQRFSASVPVDEIDASSVAPAISQAANEVATAVADWIKAQ